MSSPQPVRELNRLLPPIPGETLVSYLLRNSERLRVAPRDLIGPVQATNGRLPAFWGVRPSPAVRQGLEQRLRLSASELDGMLLGPLQHCFAQKDTLLTPQAAAWQNWVDITGSRFCTACLAADGAWQRTWRLPWRFACVQHGGWLQASCQTCGQTVGSSDTTRLVEHDNTPGHSSRVCRGREPGSPSSKRGVRLCGARLDEQPSRPAPLWALRLQVVLSAAIDGKPVALRAGELDAEAFFVEMRLVVTMLRAAAGRSDEPDAMTELLKAVTGRSTSLIARQLRADTVHGLRQRYNGGEADPQRMAAFSSAALTVLDAPDAEARARVTHLVQHLRGRDALWTSMQRSLDRPTRLSHALETTDMAVRRHISTSSTALEALPVKRFGVTHVPQLLPKPDAERIYAGLVDAETERILRRYAPLILVRMLTGEGWVAAGVRLDIPRAVTSTVERAHQILKACDALESTHERLADFALQLANGGSHLQDFAGRRAALRALSPISDADAVKLRTAVRTMPSTDAHVLREFARRVSIYQWRVLTQGDGAYSPSWRRSVADSSAQAKFERSLSQEARSLLYEHGVLKLPRRLRRCSCGQAHLTPGPLLQTEA